MSWTSPSKRYKLQLWGKNLLNQKIASARQITPQGIVFSPVAPLTFGGSLRMNF